MVAVGNKTAGWGNCLSRAGWRTSASLMSLALLQLGASASAQTSIGASPPSKVCQVVTQESAEKIVEDLYVRCGEGELFLGKATNFKTIPLDSLGSSLIDAQYKDNRRIILLTVRENGEPAAEDITGLIGLAANQRGADGASASTDWIVLGQGIASKRQAVARGLGPTGL